MAKVGRPLKYADIQELQHKIDAYFEYCDNYVILDEEGNEKPAPKPYTVSGLALWLDIDTETLRNYEVKPEFLGTIKRAKQRIEEQLELGLLTKNQVTGTIFNLKNNYGWKDRTDVTTNDKELPTPLLYNLYENEETGKEIQ